MAPIAPFQWVGRQNLSRRAARFVCVPIDVCPAGRAVVSSGRSRPSPNGRQGLRSTLNGPTRTAPPAQRLRICAAVLSYLARLARWRPRGRHRALPTALAAIGILTYSCPKPNAEQFEPIVDGDAGRLRPARCRAWLPLSRGRVLAGGACPGSNAGAPTRRPLRREARWREFEARAIMTAVTPLCLTPQGREAPARAHREARPLFVLNSRFVEKYFSQENCCNDDTLRHNCVLATAGLRSNHGLSPQKH